MRRQASGRGTGTCRGAAAGPAVDRKGEETRRRACKAQASVPENGKTKLAGRVCEDAGGRGEEWWRGGPGSSSK
jgi:hypothetical protein